MSAAERREWRISLFVERGLSQPRAQQHAERLVWRDADRDDRRSCAECAHLLYADTDGPQWTCVVQEALLLTQLQRCPAFKWEVPA